MAFDKRLLAAANQAAGTVHSRTKNSFLQAGDLGEWGPASEGEVAKAKSPARFEVCSGQLELGVGAVRSDNSHLSLLDSRGFEQPSAASNLMGAATSAFALVCVSMVK